MKTNLITLIAMLAMTAANASILGDLASATSNITARIEEARSRTLTLSELTAIQLRLHDADCQTAQGRVRWHGRVVTTDYNTNALQKVTTYADGWTHSEPFKVRTVAPVTDQMTAAAKKAANEERKAALKAAYIAREKEKLSALMAKYPEELARLLNENAKAELEPAVEVNVVVEPQ